MSEEHESHGHSVAAWTGVTILLLASIVLGVAVVFASQPIAVVGVVLVVVGIVAGVALKKAGKGAAQPEPSKPLTAEAYATDRR